MTLQFSRKEWLVLMLSLLAAGLVFTAAYFFYLSPKKEAYEMKVQELKTEEQLLNVIQQKMKQSEENTFESTMQLQKRLPVKPLLEQLLLDLEKAEIVSDSFISNMSFSEEIGKSQEDPALQPTAQTEQQENTAIPDQNNLIGLEIPLPAGMEKITVSLSVESPSYYELEKFITTLEALTRIVVVDSVNFTGSEEITSIDQKVQPLNYTLTVSAFYMPGLTDLQSQLPSMDVPEGSNKRNPLNGISEMPAEEDTTEE